MCAASVPHRRLIVDGIIADSVSLLNVVRMLGPGEPAQPNHLRFGVARTGSPVREFALRFLTLSFPLQLILAACAWPSDHGLPLRGLLPPERADRMRIAGSTGVKPADIATQQGRGRFV